MTMKYIGFTKGGEFFFGEDIYCQRLMKVSGVCSYEPTRLFQYSFVARSEALDNKTPLYV
jgi:hypothetical protein